MAEATQVRFIFSFTHQNPDVKLFIIPDQGWPPPQKLNGYFFAAGFDPLSSLTTLPIHEEIKDVLVEGGWCRKDSGNLQPQYILRTFQGRQKTTAGILTSAGGESLLVIGMEKVVLPKPEDLHDRFLNLPLEIRLALIPAHNLKRHGHGVDWVLIRTASRIDLIRLETERTECLVTDRDGYNRELLPLLAGISNGRGSSTRFATDHISSADNLGHWIQHWSSQLGSATGVSNSAAGKILWQWVIMLQLTRKLTHVELDVSGADDRYLAVSGIPDLWGFRQYPENNDILITYDSTGTTGDLCGLLIEFDRIFTSKHLQPVTEEYLQKLRDLDDTSILDRLRAELLMISRDRFEAETVAWIYTSLEEEQQGWQREMTGLEPVRKRLIFEDWTVYQPLICNVARWGVSHCLLEMTRLAGFIQERFDFQEGARLGEKGRSCSQPDLFNPHPAGTDPSGIMDDPASFLVGETLNIVGISDPDRFGICLTVLLKALALINTYKWDFRGIHTLDNIFEPRG